MAGGKLGGYDCRTFFFFSDNKACYCHIMISGPETFLPEKNGFVV